MSGTVQVFRPYKYLHKPYRVIFFESDELVLILLAVFSAMVISFKLVPVFAVGVYFLRKLKPHLPRGFLRHIPYFLGLYRFRSCPSFFDSRFQE